MSEAAIKPKRSFARELTALAALPILIWLVGWAPPYVYSAVISLFILIALYEFLVLGEKKGYPIHKALSLVLATYLLAAFVFPQLSLEAAIFATLLIIPASYVFTQADLEGALPASAVCVLGILYVGMLGGALLRLRLDFGTSGPKLVFFLLIAVWMGDSGAYYVGKNFGKRRLSPRVSPKKTVEGGLGGIFFSLVGGAVAHFTFFPEFPLVAALVAAFILSVSGVIGDLAESLWKRSAAVKDSGTLIPGHGGFLDRLDSILFTAPILYGIWLMVQQGVFS